MKLTRSSLALALTFSLSLLTFLTVLPTVSFAQDAKPALQRGYRTGYSDGYMAGYRDSIDNAAKDFSNHGEYSRADRTFNKDYGTLENYSDGYKQGFEVGYGTGYDKKSFESTVPVNIAFRGTTSNTPPVSEARTEQVVQPAANDTFATTPTTEVPAGSSNEVIATTTQDQQVVRSTYQSNDDAIVLIPKDTELILELSNIIGTSKSQVGDKFTAKVLSPSEIGGAIVEGRISKIVRPGRLKRRSQISLSFDRIILNESRWGNFNAVLTEVMPVKGDNVRRVDEEGTAVGQHSFTNDGIKIGAATGTGTVVGAIAGGPVGAAVGAGVGAAFGVGAVVIERGKDIRLNSNQQLRVRTAYETQIR